MRVFALVTDAFGGHGGIAQYNRHFLTALAAHPECTELVVLPRLMPHPPEACPPKLRQVTSGLDSKLRYFFSALFVAIRSPRFDVIFCGHINLLPLAALLRWMTGAEVILQVHGIEAWMPPARKWIRRLIPEVHLCLAVSRITRQRFLRWAQLAPHQCIVLPNTVHNPLFHPECGEPEENLRRKYGLLGRRVIMTMGRLAAEEQYKGFDEVIEAMPQLLLHIPGLVYVIAGGGNDRARLERKVNSFGLGEYVVFTGPVTEIEKVTLYRCANGFVMPSRGEGFGIVLLEAMACGTPVLASKCDGSSDALRDGMLGALVDPASPEEIRTGIRSALSHPRGVPAGLDCFRFHYFCSHLHRVLNTLLTPWRPLSPFDSMHKKA